MLPADRAALLVALVHVEALVHGRSLFGDLGLDAIDLVAYVDAVGDRSLVIVFRDKVLIEEADGLFRRRSG